VLEAETSKRFMSGVQAIGILSLLKTRFERIDGGAAGALEVRFAPESGQNSRRLGMSALCHKLP
jgi:hypothetical protein